jgi:Cd2+/Zn2+-exporting ATPase
MTSLTPGPETGKRRSDDVTRSEGATALSLRVANLDCENDAAKIDRGLRNVPGVLDLTVFPKAGRVDLRLEPVGRDDDAADRVRETLRTLGFPPQATGQLARVPRPWRNPKVLAAAASGILLLLGWWLSRFEDRGLAEGPAALLEWHASTVVYVASMLVGAYYFAREAFEELFREHEVGIELLMTVAAVVATVMGAPGEGAMLAFLYSISEAAEGYTGEKTRAAVRALMDLAPKTALVRRPEGEIEIPVEELRVGDVFIVKPGQAVPTDGIVVVGSSSVNQAPITGESVPVEKRQGDTVFAGSINGEGALEVRATKAFAENTIARIIHMVEDAQERKGNSERFIDRFGKRYSPAVLGVGILMAIVPPLLTGAPWLQWIGRATVFIVAAAPCALVISIPITLVAALGTAARKGVLIKGGVYIEELARIRVVALDKTGTITHGTPEVTEFHELPPPPGAQLPPRAQAIAMAAGVEARSQHPLAQAVLRYATQQGIKPIDVEDFKSLTAFGAAGRVAGQTVYVGSPDLFEVRLGVKLDASRALIERLQREGNTVIVVGGEGAAWALIAVRDTIRPNAAAAIRALHEVGVTKVVMLTGDNARTASAIAREVGIDEVYADLKPEDKAVRVRELTAREGHVAMVGDGVNDAPALAEATVGIAMGAAGTDVALETADVALMGDDLEKLAYALTLAKRNQRIVRQNLVLSVLVIGVLVMGAVLGRFTLPIAVIGHELSEFVVIASGLRMLRA